MNGNGASVARGSFGKLVAQYTGSLRRAISKIPKVTSLARCLTTATAVA